MEVIVRTPTEKEKKELENCPVWECRPSTFNWYCDTGETSLISEGEAAVEFDGGTVQFTAGDLVIFPKGLKCVWTVKKTIIKHYLRK